MLSLRNAGATPHAIGRAMGIHQDTVQLRLRALRHDAPDDVRTAMVGDVVAAAHERRPPAGPSAWLAAAMIEHALADLRSGGVRERREAREWFAGRRGAEGCGFDELADAIGIDADAVRERLGV